MGHTTNGWLNNALHDLLVHVVGHNWSWGVGTHTTGVRTGVAITDALVILRGGHRYDIDGVGHNDEGCFLALHELFDHNTGTGIAKGIVLEHRLDGGNGLVFGHSDDYALTSG